MTLEEMKEVLRQGWKEVFHVDEVTDETDFFMAGGDSIMAVQLPAWLIQKGIKLEMTDIFSSPTFGELAKKLKETDPIYMPKELLTKEIAAKEMGFASVEEGEKAEKGIIPIPEQDRICTPDLPQKTYSSTPTVPPARLRDSPPPTAAYSAKWVTRKESAAISIRTSPAITICRFSNPQLNSLNNIFRRYYHGLSF